jgi:hypothetical protein
MQRGAEVELQSRGHYFEAVLARQLDEYVRFDETSAVTPLQMEDLKGFPEAYPSVCELGP